MKYAFILRHREMFAVRRMCAVLGVSRSGYYDWRKRPESSRAARHRRLSRPIRESFNDSRQTYGARRIRYDLIERGESIGRHTVTRLMKRLQLVPKTVRRYRVTTDSRHTIAAPNRLAQQFDAVRPDQRWVSDITFIPTRQGWLYLAVVVDLFSRAVVGWAMNHRLKRALVIDALNMALARRSPQALELVHSDQGSQYTAAQYQQLIDDHGARCSMSRKGCCWDNAVAESFFHTLKSELVNHIDYHTRKQARLSIFDYIEAFYNRKRRHSHNGNRAPFEIELHYATNP